MAPPDHHQAAERAKEPRGQVAAAKTKQKADSSKT
jgi:hypothetical protein